MVQDMSKGSIMCGVTWNGFQVEVGLHQGSTLSPFLFVMVMDSLTDEVRHESPWAMIFVENIVMCSETREQVEEIPERWRYALERGGMKVTRRKTECMCANERQAAGTVLLYYFVIVVNAKLLTLAHIINQELNAKSFSKQ